MEKHQLQAKVKSVGMAYLFFFIIFSAHYAYLGKWGLQFLYWLTLGGLGVWALIDLFTMSGKVSRYNAEIFRQIEEIEKKDRNDEQMKTAAMFAAASGNAPKTETVTEA